MGRIADIRGERFGRLVAIDPTDDRDTAGSVMWRCKCDCGREHLASVRLLKLGKVRSCGCLRAEAIDRTGSGEDLTGRRFGRLTVSSEVERRNSKRRWLCLCDCGNEVVVLQSSLTRGYTRSCGCLSDESRRELAEGRFGITEGTSLTGINRKTPSTNKSGIKGVNWDKRYGKWRASLTFQGKRHQLGLYDSLADAAEARHEAELEIVAPFAEAHGVTIESEEEYETRLRAALARETGVGGR